MNTAQSFKLEITFYFRESAQPSRNGLTISVSSNSLNTSNADLNVPLKIVGSSTKVLIPPIEQFSVLLTRYDGQFASEVSQADFGNVYAVDNNTALCGFDEAEERKSKRAFSRTSSSNDPHLK